MPQIQTPNDGSSSGGSSSSGRRKQSAPEYLEDPVKSAPKSKLYAFLAVMTVTVIIIAVIAIAAS